MMGLLIGLALLFAVPLNAYGLEWWVIQIGHDQPIPCSNRGNTITSLACFDPARIESFQNKEEVTKRIREVDATKVWKVECIFGDFIGKPGCEVTEYKIIVDKTIERRKGQ